MSAPYGSPQGENPYSPEGSEPQYNPQQPPSGGQQQWPPQPGHPQPQGQPEVPPAPGGAEETQPLSSYMQQYGAVPEQHPQQPAQPDPSQYGQQQYGQEQAQQPQYGQQQYAGYQQYPGQYPPQSGGSGGKLWLILIPVLLLVLVGGGVGAFFLLKDDDSDDDNGGSKNGNSKNGGTSLSDEEQAKNVAENFAQAMKDDDYAAASALLCRDMKDRLKRNDKSVEESLEDEDGRAWDEVTLKGTEKISDERYDVKLRSEIVKRTQTFPVVKEDGEWLMCQSVRSSSGRQTSGPRD